MNKPVPAKRSEKKFDLSYEANVGLIHTLTKYGYKMALSSHCGMDYDDMFQEASIAFVLATRGYDPTTGLTFSAYYSKVALSQFRKSTGVMSGVKNLNDTQREEIAARKSQNSQRAAAGQEQLPDVTYGLRPMSFTELEGRGEEGDPFVESIASEIQSPEQALEFKQEWERITAKLSPMAQLVVEWLRDPPPELVRELNSLNVLADRGKEHSGRAPRSGMRDGLTLANIGRFLNLLSDGKTKGEFALVEKELMGVVAQLEI